MISEKQQALFDYLREFHGELLTERERQIWGAWVAERKSRGDSVSARGLRQAYGIPEDAEILAAAGDSGWGDFVTSVTTRVLREHGKMLRINRCPKCLTVVRTPMARQCLWCGHDWH